MATIEELLGLPPEGAEAILKMSAEELAIYLKPISILEPAPVNLAQLVGKDEDDDGEPKPRKRKKVDTEIVDKLVGEISDDNPINKKKRGPKIKDSDKSLLQDIEKMIADGTIMD